MRLDSNISDNEKKSCEYYDDFASVISKATTYKTGASKFDDSEDDWSIESNESKVNISDAKRKYNKIKRELSQVSRSSTRVDRIEEGQAKADEFNLDEFLHGIRNDFDFNGQVPKHLGIVWRDLTVQGNAAGVHTIPTNASYFQFWKALGLGVSKEKKTILNGISGHCKEGEMLLVLGRPGAGCSSFLKVIANITGAFTAVKGLVSYGGIESKEFSSLFRGQVCYNEEEDQHYPTLTVKQTLEFALRMKTPGNRLPNETKEEFVNKIHYMLGNMLGLTKQMNTMVGNAYVRGLSGGERKRMSIAEQMTTSSSINCWDCSTRGLDAASALDYVKSLRIMTDIFQKTTIATLYQASNDIFKLFDKVLLLDEGRCLYFGPTSQAKGYFESLGLYCPSRKTIPDFLTSLCNPNEREVLPGFENKAPKFAEEFEKTFLLSAIYKQSITELQEYEISIKIENPQKAFSQAVKDEHQKRASKSSPYTASLFQQIKSLTIRQYHLNKTDIESLISRYGTILIESLITASCFFRMSEDGAGAFARGGAIFFSVIFNSFVSQTELVSFMNGRPVLDKHKQYALYSPTAFYLAQVVMDVPYAIAQVFLFSICAYFMFGLKSTGSAFFTFALNIFFLIMGMNGFFRLFGATSPNFFMASQYAGTALLVVQLYCGYAIVWTKMHPWLSWIYWLDPLTYSYKALLTNEMKNTKYSCEGAGNGIPFGPGYDNWNYKVCAMKGGRPGENYVLGDNYLDSHYSFHVNEEWAPDFTAVVAFFLFFTVACCFCMEYLNFNKGGTLTKLYLPGKSPKKRTKEEEEKRLRKQNEGIQTNGNTSKQSVGTTFSWQDVDYTVPTQNGSVQLLNNVSGIVRPGHLTALMGSSGAGKTTLLDVLARRKTIGKVDGRIYLNNEILLSDFERVTGYCEQMDVHQPAVTVREALRFSAYLRQDPSVPKEEKNAYVENIIQLLEMEDIGDAQIGLLEEGFGISIEERKRLTIGMELVGKPKLLFLDEPTSGLDAQSSYNIIRFIRKLANAGWPVLCTIHQPSAILFEQFDHLLLLVRGGRTAFHGPVGKDSSLLINYFETNGGPKYSLAANPAEYILECVGAGTAGKAKTDWANVWEKSPQCKALREELEDIHFKSEKNPSRTPKTYANSYWVQFCLVLQRMMLCYWRSPNYNAGRLIGVIFTALMAGFTFWKIGHSSSDMINKIFVLFGTFLMALNLIILAQPKFITERQYFRREYASRYYSWLPFGLSVILVEIPYIVFYSAAFTLAFYWTAGMHNSSEAIAYFYLALTVLVFWAVTLGFVTAAICESPVMASIINPLIISTLILFAGLMQPEDQMPKFWSSWMYHIDPFHYYIEGLAVNELEHAVIICDDSDLYRFSPPPNTTCGAYITNFFKFGATGYIDNPHAVQPELCGYCVYKSGPEFYKAQFGWHESHKWQNLLILLGFFAFNVIAFLGLVYLKRKPRR